MGKKELQRFFWRRLLPAVAIYLGLAGAREVGFAPVPPLRVQLAAPLVFVFGTAFSVAAPILYRAAFAHRVRRRSALDFQEYLAHEKTLLRLVLVTPYLLAFAVLWQFPKFYHAAMILLALYGCYAYFPSEKRLHLDRRIFRVQEGQS